MVWHLPASRTKTATALDIPLVPEVVGWLRELKRLAASSEYLFPKRRRDPRERVPHVGLDTLNVALERVPHGLRPFGLPDLRRTARTQLAALGIRREVAERCLGQPLRGVEGTYDRHDYFKERRAALAQRTALLLETERPKDLPVAVRAADVLGWAGALPGDTDRKGNSPGAEGGADSMTIRLALALCFESIRGATIRRWHASSDGRAPCAARSRGETRDTVSAPRRMHRRSLGHRDRFPSARGTPGPPWEIRSAVPRSRQV